MRFSALTVPQERHLRGVTVTVCWAVRSGSAILVDDNRNGVNTWAVDIYCRTRVVGVATELFFRLVGSWAFDQYRRFAPGSDLVFACKGLPVNKELFPPVTSAP